MNSHLADSVVSMVLPHVMVIDSESVVQAMIISFVNLVHSVWHRRHILVVIKSSVVEIEGSVRKGV